MILKYSYFLHIPHTPIILELLLDHTSDHIRISQPSCPSMSTSRMLSFASYLVQTRRDQELFYAPIHLSAFSWKLWRYCTSSLRCDHSWQGCRIFVRFLGQWPASMRITQWFRVSIAALDPSETSHIVSLRATSRRVFPQVWHREESARHEHRHHLAQVVHSSWPSIETSIPWPF
jgi:hypothetical protein